MTSKVPFPPPGFDELSINEQIKYVGKLGERIPSLPDDTSDPDIAIIEERLEYYEKNGMEGISWEQFQKDLILQLIKR
ncbi:MAG TPA: addiction module protein [Pyrinomonadaceae bacterium]|nr:addiction module protein [Pyrinomonadaceae bacterium]